MALKEKIKEYDNKINELNDKNNNTITSYKEIVKENQILKETIKQNINNIYTVKKDETKKETERPFKDKKEETEKKILQKEYITEYGQKEKIKKIDEEKKDLKSKSLKKIVLFIHVY